MTRDRTDLVPLHVDPASRGKSTLGVLGAALAVALVSFGVATFGQLPTNADTTADVAPSATGAPLGWLAVETGGTSRVTLNTSAGPNPIRVQSITADRGCAVKLGTPSLLGLRGSLGGDFDPKLASFASGSLGVKEKKSGTSCYQVNSATTEKLELTVGADVGSALGAPALMSAALLDLELKQSAQIRATASNGQETRQFELRSGTSAQPLSPAVPDVDVAKCVNGADSGPDSGVGDNCRWAISASDSFNFDTLTLEAIQGSFSVEGGGDGQVTTVAEPLVPSTPSESWATSGASLINLVDGYEGVLDCNEPTLPEEADGDSPWVKIYRLDNADGSTCSAVEYTLTNGPLFARFVKPIDDQPTAQFVWEVKWRIDDTGNGATTVMEDLTLDYETGGSDPVPLGWCPDPSYQETAPYYQGYQLTPGQPGDQSALLSDQDEYPGVQFACVISRTATVMDGGDPGPADDYLEARDLVYVLGDAVMRR